MKIHRFIDNFNLFEKEIEIAGKIAKQIVMVLKLKIGEKIELCDEKGISAMAEIVEINKKRVLVKILETKNTMGKQIVVNLFCAVLKKENFELVVQKTTETGVSKIIPIITARTVKTGLNLERLKKIAKEASEQCGRTTVPEISEPMKFEDALKNIKGKSILFDISGSELTNNYKLITNNLFIGPEGGWTPLEIEKVKSLNFKIASLGPLTLRGETAAIIATYIITH